jgi:heat shock 70kDa protein 4
MILIANNGPTCHPTLTCDMLLRHLQVSQDAPYLQVFHAEIPVEVKNRLLEEEGQMSAADALQRATDEAKNALEAYVYDMRSKVQGAYADFAKPEEREAFVSELNTVEDWLYEDGEDEKKSVCC